MPIIHPNTVEDKRSLKNFNSNKGRYSNRELGEGFFTGSRDLFFWVT